MNLSKTYIDNIYGFIESNLNPTHNTLGWPGASFFSSLKDFIFIHVGFDTLYIKGLCNKLDTF